MEQKKPFDDAFQYLDLPSVAETFVDGVHYITADNTTARMILTISRGDAPQPGSKKPTGKKVCAARIVMPTGSFITLYNQMHNIMMALEHSGLAKRDGAQVKATMQ